MVNSGKKLKNKKILLSTILAIIMLVSFAAQAYGATVQSAKAVSKTTKTYVYGFNINDSGRWTGKAYRQIKICPLSSSKLNSPWGKDNTSVALYSTGPKYLVSSFNR